MKLIIAIISNDDSYDVLSELTKAGLTLRSCRHGRILERGQCHSAHRR